MIAEEFIQLPRLNGKKVREGKGWKVCCPGHNDRNPSLSVDNGDKGVVLVCRSANCSTASICDALGIKVSDLFHEKRNGSHQQPRIVKEYDYHDADGNLAFQVVRLEPKSFRQRRPDGNGGWLWSVPGDVRVLYKLPRIVKSSDTSPVWITEGEKDADNLTAAGVIATCNSGGAGKWLDVYTEALRNRHVILCGDNDKPGREHVAKVAEALQGTAASIRFARVPAPHKDVSDYLQTIPVEDRAQAVFKLGEAATDELDDPPAAEPVIARKLSELQRHTDDDPAELLRYRFLCRGSGVLLAGPTGVGKSVAELQMQLCFAAGQPCFGIQPVKPLRSLLIQAENDDGDMAEMRDGIITGMRLPTGIADSITVVRHDRKTSVAFFNDVCRPLLEEHRPDILWIDPAFAYLGGNSKEQVEVSAFLRNGLNPLLREFDCGGFVIHHTNKPPSGKEKPDWSGSDFAYLGSGSAEWANWARAVLALRAIGSDSVFELRAGKRGARLGWKDSDGQPSFVRHIAHSDTPGVIYWRDAGPEEVVTKGRPKKATASTVLALLPRAGLSTSQWQEKAKTEEGVSRTVFFELKRDLMEAGRVHQSTTNDQWQPITTKPK